MAETRSCVVPAQPKARPEGQRHCQITCLEQESESGWTPVTCRRVKRPEEYLFSQFHDEHPNHWAAA